MTHPLYIAFIWHQHQPIYKSQQAGEYRLPWVRLHGTKDYLDLILQLERYPKLHQTVNLVPSLILQLEDYARGTAVDHYQKLTLTAVEDLKGADKREIIDHFFDANPEYLIIPHARYSQLYSQRQEKGLEWCLQNWQGADYGDMLAWHNLAWIDPIFWDDPEIAQWLEQGKNFTLADRQKIITKQREIIQRIIPHHRLMQERGQLEISTTPYTHPILPLLADSESGRVAVPGMPLPEKRFQWAEDIPRHLSKAKEIYESRFGCQPKGLWPSEQSVSPTILPYVAEQGFQWLCSDEMVLGQSLGHIFSRDEQGNVYDPELLYRPYRLETPQGDLSIVFRDHRLSDLIGFTYSTMKADKAAEDLIGHLEAISASLQAKEEGGGSALEEPWLVTIALDGENCWEFYEKDGQPFFEALYQRFSDHPALKLVTVAEYLEQFPPTATIPSQNLHSGSWIDGTFTTWIGESAKNRAWDLLAAARMTLAEHPEATETTNPAAWEALYAAQGSDWFWWLGTGHSSHNDETFDLLFRENLITLYQALNEPVPANLYTPIDQHLSTTDRPQEGWINITIDGYGQDQGWEKAGRIEIGGARGTMHRSSLIQRLFYGSNHFNFFLRLDLQPGYILGKDLPTELHLFWYYSGIDSATGAIALAGVPTESPLNYQYHHHLGVNLTQGSIWLEEAQNGTWQPRSTNSQAVLKKCLEIAVPWADLHTHPGTKLHLVALLAENGTFKSYVPQDSLVGLQMP